MKMSEKKLKKKKKRSATLSLNFLFLVIIFGIITVTLLITAAVGYLLMFLGVISGDVLNNFWVILFYVASSIVVGMLIASVVIKIPMNPIKTLIKGLNSLADGDYKARVNIGGMKGLKQLSESFNTLAAELENTEMLRSDFVNNFSHEFKTPIVSIRGFAKLLLKDSGMPEDRRNEYLEIICDESTRLADMATNVMNLTKLENQGILTDKSNFNVSEQLRACVLLLEKKWEEKKLSLDMEFDEYSIFANEELLKQVWINLIDNAIKFSPDGEEIKIAVTSDTKCITVAITNHGDEISEEEKSRIFNKFYQGEKSHSGDGAGIGLAVVKKIVDLHNGRIFLTSGNGLITFTVILPVK